MNSTCLPCLPYEPHKLPFTIFCDKAKYSILTQPYRPDRVEQQLQWQHQREEQESKLHAAVTSQAQTHGAVTEKDIRG